ncbi:MAG: KTSC domain-containing protein [Chloroflexi bacterium]|nr:MAG: KTSC domain-containing protein [Chloroflexota bacterium]
MAQAITDWLTIGGLREIETEVAQLVTVRSTMLYAIGYNAATETLEVVFNSGGIYRYFHVPPDVYRGLVAAESKGRYMWSNVFNLYPYVRLRRG